MSGIRVLSMEQAVALPFATRHLADLGADVIRIQSHKRRSPGTGEIDLTRNKRQLAIDLAAPGGRDIFLRIARECDVVAHNFTPRVVRQFGIDYEGVRRVRPDVIYVSLTGFGTTGPWGERPLFGPGAEAVAGHNLLIGDPDAWPGRPGTNVYGDVVCGMNATFAVLAALEERERTGRGQHIDISLYETAVSFLGPVIAAAQLGAEPRRLANQDANFAVHGVFDCAGTDRHIALAVRSDQMDDLAAALGITEPSAAAVQQALASMDADTATSKLQARGIAAHVVSDAADVVNDEHLWSRRYFATVERSFTGKPELYAHAGPAWGGGPLVPLQEAHPLGADTAVILREIGGYSDEEVAEFARADVIGLGERDQFRGWPAPDPVRVTRGELSRIEPDHDGWKRFARPAEAAR
ncbi:MAG TPA: CoA transferase [Dehalococcoidia bacterium]|nr:CoA transferase [Dehalococcoidia bacterium]